jgi:transcription-repair coupling factor (superfamily II helicase)
MKFLNRVIFTEPEYKKLLSDAQTGNLPIAATGLSAVHKAAFISSLREHTNKKVVVFTPDEASAVTLCNDLISLGLTALNLPLRDYNLVRVSCFSREYEPKRIITLS